MLTTEDIMALDPKKVELAISMPAFRKLNQGRLMYELAPLVRVYGRMRPNDKSTAVKLLQNHNLVVGMCGDGGNDTAALRTAHFGYALSDADASLVAPISSKDPSLLRVNDTLCAARATLATSLGIFMWSAVLGGVYPAFKIVNIWTNGNMLGEVPGIFLEYAIETMLVFLMALCRPLEKLTGYRPTQRLLGLNIALQVFVPITIWTIFLVATRLSLASFSWFEQFNARDMSMPHRDQYTVRSDAYQVEVDVFRMYCFYTAMALIYSLGHQVRQALWKNWALMVWCAGVFGWMFFLILQQNTTIGCFMRFNCDSQTTLGLKSDPFSTFWSPFLNYKVAGGCVYGPQIKHWVEASQNGKGKYTFPDGDNNCHIGEAGYAQDLWGPQSLTGTDCVGPNNCLPMSGKLLAIGSGIVTIACCVLASFMIAGVRLRFKKQFHRL
jgi:cation-transporting ATPase 13A3/4/5